MNSVLDLGPGFIDITATGEMRNAYLINLFRLEHVLELFKKGPLARQCIFSSGHWYSALFSRRNSLRDRESSFRKWLDLFLSFEQVSHRLGEGLRYPYPFPIVLRTFTSVNKERLTWRLLP
jgi:hypothetical protein